MENRVTFKRDSVDESEVSPNTHGGEAGDQRIDSLENEDSVEENNKKHNAQVVRLTHQDIDKLRHLQESNPFGDLLQIKQDINFLAMGKQPNVRTLFAYSLQQLYSIELDQHCR